MALTQEDLNSYLRINDLKDVHEELIDVSSKWYSIGLRLNLQPGVLDRIKEYKDANSCLCEMLKLWLKGVHPSPTWKVLIKALKSRSVSEADLAKRLKRKYCRKIVTDHLPISPLPCEVSTSSTDEDVDTGVGTASTISTASAVTTTHLDGECLGPYLMTRSHCSACGSSTPKHVGHKSTPHSGQKSATLPQNGILVTYTYINDWYEFDTSNLFGKRIKKSEITLGYFKEKVFSRKGDYRFFFKTYYHELDTEVMEEYTDYDDSTLLPVSIMARGKRVVIGTVTCS